MERINLAPTPQESLGQEAYIEQTLQLTPIRPADSALDKPFSRLRNYDYASSKEDLSGTKPINPDLRASQNAYSIENKYDFNKWEAELTDYIGQSALLDIELQFAEIDAENPESGYSEEAAAEPNLMAEIRTPEIVPEPEESLLTDFELEAVGEDSLGTWPENPDKEFITESKYLEQLNWRLSRAGCMLDGVRDSIINENQALGWKNLKVDVAKLKSNGDPYKVMEVIDLEFRVGDFLNQVG